MRALLPMVASALVVVCLVEACGGSDSNTPSSASPTDGGAATVENTGRSCKVPADCYSGLDAGSLAGEVQCLDRVTGGYCTHLCTTDADCCAVSGECRGGLKQVCASFESTGQMMCFLSCEAADIRAAPDAGAVDGGALDDSAYCAAYASSSFGCRSTGGGSKNRKVCLP